MTFQPKLKSLYILSPQAYEWIYGPTERAAIAQLVDFIAPPQTAAILEDNPDLLHEVDAIFSGWGAPVFTSDLLAHTPNLKVIFYGAGSVKGLVTPEFWARRIRLTSAYAANAVPVVEYSLAMILLGLKSVWQHVQHTRTAQSFERLPSAGAFHSTVGLVSLGMIGRLLVERLRTFEVSIIAYDPFVKELPGVEMVALAEVFRRADVVSLHTPWLKETEGLVTGTHIASLKPYATFINTSRGAVVREEELIAVLQQRPDLVAVLDVTYPEPPSPDSPLYTLPNVILTPHIAGSVGSECQRMGQVMLSELRRYLAGELMQYEMSEEKVRNMA